MQAEDLQKRQVHLQKRICILLCTVFPLLTTVATLLRLWQGGVFTFPVQQGRKLFFPPLRVHSSTILVCPRGWHSFSSSCISPLPVPANWSSATHACAGLGAHLPTVHSEQMNNFLLTKFQPPLWLAARTGNATLTWSHGQSFNFSKLNNAPQESDNCLVLAPSGAWELRSCQLQLLTICQRTGKSEEDKPV